MKQVHGDPEVLAVYNAAMDYFRAEKDADGLVNREAPFYSYDVARAMVKPQLEAARRQLLSVCSREDQRQRDVGK